MVNELQVPSRSAVTDPWASSTSWEREAAALRHYTPQPLAAPKPPLAAWGGNQPTPAPSAAWMGGGTATLPRTWHEARDAVADYHPTYAYVPGTHAHDGRHIGSLGGGNQPPWRVAEVAPWMEQVALTLTP